MRVKISISASGFPIGENRMRIQISLSTDLEVYTAENGFYAWTQPDLKSVKKLTEFLSPLKIAKPMDLHTTLMYSKTPITGLTVGATKSQVNKAFRATAQVLELVWWAGHDDTGYLVARVDNKVLKTLHEKWKRLGAVSTFPDYEAHLTLANPCADSAELQDFIKEHNETLTKTPLHISYNTERISDLS